MVNWPVRCSSRRARPPERRALDYYLTGSGRARDQMLEYAAGIKKLWTPEIARRDWRQLMLMRLLIQCYQSKQRNEGRFEAHARHTDLQYVWSGRECIEVCELRAVQPQPAYDANGNFFFPIGDAAHSQLLVQAGEVAVLLPQDAHAPCLRTTDDDGELVRKMVVKIQDANLPASALISSVSAETARAAQKT